MAGLWHTPGLSRQPDGWQETVESGWESPKPAYRPSTDPEGAWPGPIMSGQKP